MATVYSHATGNFTAAATWALVDATSFQDTEAASTGLTAAFVASQNFTPGAITIDGLAVKVATRPGSSGTWTTQLFDATAGSAVAGTTITLNVTDVDPSGGGFYLFKFPSNVTLIAGHNYNVQAKASAITLINLFRSATAGDWSRVLRTTTNQAPAATDKAIVGGDFTGPAASNIWTVTVNTTSATTYGEVQVGNDGILTWATSGAPYLKLGGNLNVYGSGIYNMGTSGTPIPSTTTAQLEFANAAPVQFGFQAKAGHTVNIFGATVTVRAMLAANASGGNTTLTTNVSTGWLNGNVIALASTSRTPGDRETTTLTGNAAGTSVPVTAIANLHSGTSPTQADIALLSRNVQIFSTSTTNNTFINIATPSNFNAQYAEFFNMGSATALERGIDIATASGTCSFQFCSLHDFTAASSIGFNVNSVNAANVTLSNNVFWNINTASINTAAFTGSTPVFNNNLAIGGATAANQLTYIIISLKGTITNNTASSGASSGFSLTDATAPNTGVCSGNIAYSNGAAGIVINSGSASPSIPWTCLNPTCWNNVTFGILTGGLDNMVISGGTFFGNGTSGTSNNANFAYSQIINCVYNAGVTFTQPVGHVFGSDCIKAYFDNCTFGVTTPHATADINVSGSPSFVNAIFRNCQFSSTTLFTGQANITFNSWLGFQKYQQTAGNHQYILKYGTIVLDTVRTHVSGFASKMTPNNAANKLASLTRPAAVVSGKTITFNVFVYKSSVANGDAANYNGNQPRLIVKANPALGTNTDTVLATAVTAIGNWELLTGATTVATDNGGFEAYVDCDGTIGFVSATEWTVF
jgi:hypothetical protein